MYILIEQLMRNGITFQKYNISTKKLYQSPCKNWLSKKKYTRKKTSL